MHDRLPDKAKMLTLFQEFGINVLTFIDESGFYCVKGER